MRRRQKGFTLIELMIVIAIIAILAAILVPNFLKARAQGQFTACKSNVRNISTACEMYAVDNSGVYPSNLGLLTSGTTPYMKNVPNCSTAGTNTYTFGSNSSYGFSTYCTGSKHSPVIGNNDGPGFGSTSGLVDLKSQVQ